MTDTKENYKSKNKSENKRECFKCPFRTTCTSCDKFGKCVLDYKDSRGTV